MDRKEQNSNILSVIESHSYKVLSRTVRKKVILFPEGFLYFEARLQFEFFNESKLYQHSQ